jgi:catechol 2,3-dioxygenase-like lactoylglutathione lyase family enzyme
MPVTDSYAGSVKICRNEGLVGVQLDHMILAVNDRGASVDFYSEIMGFAYEGEREPFSVLRVTPEFTLQLAPWGTSGGEHLAFAMSRPEFDEAFRRVRDAGIPFGDSFHDVGNMQGPGEEEGARGMGKAVYLFDPSKHLVEIRHYDVDR